MLNVQLGHMPPWLPQPRAALYPTALWASCSQGLSPCPHGTCTQGDQLLFVDLELGAGGARASENSPGVLSKCPLKTICLAASHLLRGRPER